MTTSIPPATTPTRPHHPNQNHIPAGHTVATPDRAFINNSDDARNLPSEPYRNLIIDAGCSVTVHDPHVLEYPGVDISHELDEGAGFVSVLTGHDAGKCTVGQQESVRRNEIGIISILTADERR